MDSEHNELLIRLDERTRAISEMLSSHLSKAENGGWSRCVKRGEQLDSVSRDLDDHVKDHKWLNRTIGGAFVASVGSLAVALIIYFMG